MIYIPVGNVQANSLVARDKSSLNSVLLKPWTVSDSLKNSLVQISMASSEGMLVNREYTSKLPIKRSCWSTISSTKWKDWIH